MFGRKQPVLLPGSLQPTILVLLRNSLPSSVGFIALCASQLMPQITVENYVVTGFYVVVPGVAVVFLQPLTVMEISDPSAQVLIPKGRSYFQHVPFTKKKKKSGFHLYTHGFMTVQGHSDTSVQS